MAEILDRYITSPHRIRKCSRAVGSVPDDKSKLKKYCPINHGRSENFKSLVRNDHIISSIVRNSKKQFGYPTC